MANNTRLAGRPAGGRYDAAKIDQRIDMLHRYVLALEALGASSALLSAVQLLDGIVVEQNALIHLELAQSLGAPRLVA
jgi:hypothetical protein